MSEREHAVRVLLGIPDAPDRIAYMVDVLAAERERAAEAVEALRPHIPPSTDPGRRTAVIVRSTLNRAARAIRKQAAAP